MSGGVSFFFFKNMNDKKKTGFFRFRSLNATATAFDTRSPNSISFSSSPWAKTSEACTWSCGGRWTVVWEGTKKGGKLKRFFFLREKEQREKKRHSRKKKKRLRFFPSLLFHKHRQKNRLSTLTEYRNLSFETLSLAKTVRRAGETDERRRRWPLGVSAKIESFVLVDMVCLFLFFVEGSSFWSLFFFRAQCDDSQNRRRGSRKRKWKRVDRAAEEKPGEKRKRAEARASVTRKNEKTKRAARLSFYQRFLVSFVSVPDELFDRRGELIGEGMRRRKRGARTWSHFFL